MQNRGLPITFKATAVSKLLLGRRGRPWTAKFYEFRKKVAAMAWFIGSSSGKPRDLPWICPSILLPWFMASPVGPAHPSIRASILLRSPTPALADRFEPTLQPGASEPPRSLGVSGLIRSTASGDLIPPRTQYILTNPGRIPSIAVVFWFVPIFMFFVDPKTCGRKSFVRCFNVATSPLNHNERRLNS